MEKKYRKSLDKLHYDRWYQSGLKASVDWVAGGNFEGSISMSFIRFLKGTDMVEIRTDRISDRGGSKTRGTVIQGKFTDGGKGAINLKFKNRSMRGFVLGRDDEYIAFESFFPGIKYSITEAYVIIGKDKE